MQGRFKVLLRLRIIVKGKIDGAKIGVSGGANLRVLRQSQDRLVAHDGLCRIYVLLGVDPQIELADGISGLEVGRGAEVGDGFVIAALTGQGTGKIIFRDVILIGDGESVRPESKIVMPVRYLSARDRGENEDNGDSNRGAE